MKRIYLLLIMAVMTMAMSAQSIIGNWQSEDIDDGSAKGFITMDFSSNFLKITFDMTTSDADMGSIHFAVSVNGSYTINDNNIIFAVDKNSIDFRIIETNFSEAIRQAMALDPSIGQQIENMLKTAVTDEKDGLTSVFDKNESMTVTELTDNTMQIVSGSETYNMHRLK